MTQKQNECLNIQTTNIPPVHERVKYSKISHDKTMLKKHRYFIYDPFGQNKSQTYNFSPNVTMRKPKKDNNYSLHISHYRTLKGVNQISALLSQKFNFPKSGIVFPCGPLGVRVSQKNPHKTQLLAGINFILM